MTTYSEPGIFNVLDAWLSTYAFGMVANSLNTDYTTAQWNARVLQAAIFAAQAATATNCPSSYPFSGKVLIPGHNVVPQPVGAGGTDNGAEYFIAMPPEMETTGAAVLINCYWPLRILGTGNVKLTMIANVNGLIGDIFQLATGTGGDAGIGGLTFEDLILKYAPITGSQDLYAAIHATSTGAQNLRIERVVFEECPVGVRLEEALQCSVLQCTFNYLSSTGTAIILGNGQNMGESNSAKQIYIAGCYLLNDSAHGALPGGTGILILGCDQARVVETDIGGFTQAVSIAPGPYGQNAVHISFANCGIYAGPLTTESSELGTALTIQPSALPGQSSELMIGSVTFTNCRFDAGEATPTSTQGAGVTVNNNGSTIDTVRFVSCISTRWTGPGLEIAFVNGTNAKLQNVEVLGGMYAGNNLGEGGSKPYGILITGAVSGVRVVGASCVGHYHDITNNGSSTSPTQNVGIYVDQGATDVIIDACDLRLNGTNGVSVNGESGAVTTNVFIRNCDVSGYSGGYSAAIAVSGAAYISNFQVTDSAGYNDQQVVLRNSTPPTSASTFHSYDLTNPYWGPFEFYIAINGASVTGIYVDGIETHLTSGSFYIAPGENAETVWAGVGLLNPTFLAIGK